MAFIEIIEPENASGELKEIYENLLQSRGKLAEVHKLQSLHPETITHHMDLYLSIMFSRSPLSRAQREMMAIVVSASNNCEYCQLHHAEALNNYWKDYERIQKLREDFKNAELNELDIKLCSLAHDLTLDPDGMQEEEHIQPLRKLGLSDRGILDAMLVISYFNFVNRMVIGLGAEHNQDEVKGYHY